MISTDHDRRFHFPRPNECVEDKSCLLPLAQSEPADSCGQTLKRDALPRLLQPAVEVVVVRKRLHQRVVCGIDVIGVSGQGYPAERPLALAKKGAYVGRHKPGKRERVLLSPLQCKFTKIVAVVEHDTSSSLQFKHEMNMPRHTPQCELLILRRITSSQGSCLVQTKTVRYVTVDWIMR